MVVEGAGVRTKREEGRGHGRGSPNAGSLGSRGDLRTYQAVAELCRVVSRRSYRKTKSAGHQAGPVERWVPELHDRRLSYSQDSPAAMMRGHFSKYTCQAQ